LGAFALRSDLARIWSPDGSAFAAYRIEAGALMLAGDPVGDPASHGAVLDEAIRLAKMHGLAWGAVGVGDAFAVVAQGRGLRRLYVGDEAIMATGCMDLSGRARKGLRTTMNRIVRLGYIASLHRIGDLDPVALAELQTISDAWRDGAEERGFSMSHDQLADRLLPDAMVVIARDADGIIDGFLHFMPVFGEPQASLGFMRRAHETPNGLTEFLILRAAELLADEGIAEMSLNFAAFAGLRRNPRHAGERAVVRILLGLDHFFHIGGLELFNAKFDPRWQRRHLLFNRPASLPRAAIAALVCEGYLPAWPGSAATLPPPVSGRVAPAA
jgi:lysyl-tRNA synthetase class 2